MKAYRIQPGEFVLNPATGLWREVQSVEGAEPESPTVTIRFVEAKEGEPGYATHSLGCLRNVNLVVRGEKRPI